MIISLRRFYRVYKSFSRCSQHQESNETSNHIQQPAWLAQSVERETLNRDHLLRKRLIYPKSGNSKSQGCGFDPRIGLFLFALACVVVLEIQILSGCSNFFFFVGVDGLF